MSSDISIQGPGQSALTIDANQTGRVFNILFARNVDISNLTISNGRALFSNAAAGGNIFNSGRLTLTHTTIRGGRAENIGSNASIGYAGGIHNALSGQLTLYRSEVIENTSYVSSLSDYAVTVYGAGISNLGEATIVLSRITNNQSGTKYYLSNVAYGVGIYNTGSLLLDSSLVANNRTGPVPQWVYGGGIASLSGGTVVVQNSTIANNQIRSASFSSEVGYAFGGGMFLQDSIVAIRNSTMAGNAALAYFGFGGGIYATGSGSLTLKNNILAANFAPDGGPDILAVFTSMGHNLVGNPIGGDGYIASDLVGIDPLLSPLSDNGGPTHTMALLPGSPAIDAGDNTDAPEWDQRGPGFPRIVNGSIDIGAFEVQASPMPKTDRDWSVLLTADFEEGSLR